MTEQERQRRIAEHLEAHERKVAKRRVDRIARQMRNKRRGLDAAIARMREAQQ